MTELWKPGHNTGTDDPDKLEQALRDAIEAKQLPVRSKMPPPQNKRLSELERDGLLIEAVLRFLPQKNLRGGGPFGLDWILLSANELQQLAPEKNTEFPIVLPTELATKILIQLRPPVETAEDPTERAIPLLKHVELQLLSEEEINGTRYIRLAGKLHLKEDPFPDPIDDHIRWAIVENYLEAEGFVELDNSGKVVDLQLVTTKGLFLPPHQKVISYDGVTHVYRPQKLSQ